MNEVMMTETELCERLRISQLTAWRLRRSGKLAHFRVGGQVRYSKEQIEKFLANSETKGQAGEPNNNPRHVTPKKEAARG